jgi:arylformamidase
MNYFDLSHVLNEQTPVYPGKGQPIIKKIATISKEGYRETELKIDSHLGTHIDAPAHMIEDGKYLNQFPVSRFTGKALIIKVQDGTKIISKSFLETFVKEIETADFVLFNTGWGKLWGSDEYFKNFPVLDEEAANWLISFYIKGIGIDAISVDPVETNSWNNHFLLFNEDIIIIENLVFPESIDSVTGEFYCFPLSIEEADGSPVRAIFRIDESLVKNTCRSGGFQQSSDEGPMP